MRTVLGAVFLAGAAVALWITMGRPGDAVLRSPGLSPADARQQEILQQSLDLPGDPALERMYQAINIRHFAGGLPAMPVLYQRRLEEVGALADRTFMLKGMFGRSGKRMAILLHPALHSDPRELERALCHEMVHAYLFATGDTTSDHGPAFQNVLRRLADEGAFAGVVASEEDREQLRAWLDAESARLDAERHSMDLIGAEIEQERVAIERAFADLDARGAAVTAAEVDAFNARRDAYNDRARTANARAERDRADVAEFNRQVERYNLMITYPDGLDAAAVVKPKTSR
ncbi:MAG TPA: SprT-like domain-containing protein [Vicinamibacterales bacterium]|nr:SprT-like domain-containing protein [Vicinamibacterales bacterium]